MAKYRMLRERLAATSAFDAADFLIPQAANDIELTRAHCPDYVRRASTGALSKDEQRLIGFPWSEAMVERSRRSSGATLGACRLALRDGVAANLAGGTHHAFRDRGEGFSVFNDAAVSARAMQAERLVQRVLVVDLDVHQGNGTASIFADDDSVFTFSMHGAKNYPFRREHASDLDIDLPDGTSDEDYLALLAQHLPEVIAQAQPDLAIYLAGADPYEGDRLGRLKLSKSGLNARDEYVFTMLKRQRIPVAVAMAGGYAHVIEDTVDIHFNTIMTAQRVFA